MPTVVGTNVTIGQTVGTPPVTLGNGGTYFVAGITQRGSTTTAQLLTSMSDYAKYMGASVSYGYLYNDLTTFFAEGGQQAYVARTVGTGACAGILTLQDNGASAQSTITLTANSMGEWSSTMNVEVVNNGASPGAGGVANTFSLYIRLTGSSVPVESYLNVATPAALVSAMASSNYVTATNLGSTNVSPTNNPKTVNGGTTGTGTAFGTGVSNYLGVVAANYLTAASTLFTPDLGSGIMAVPGQAAANVVGLIPFAASTNRTVILVPAQGQSNTQAESTCSAAQSSASFPQNAGFFWPWVQIPNGYGGTTVAPPDGFVAGTRARQAAATGVWRANFGVAALARYVVGIDPAYALTPTTVQEVFAVGVNPIRLFSGTPELYGWQSLTATTPGTNYQWLSAMDLLNWLAVASGLILENYIGQPIDAKGALLEEISASLTSLVEPIAQVGGLYSAYDNQGNVTDPGYAVNVGAALNPPANLAIGTITATLGVRMAPAAQLINVTVSKTGFTAAM